MLAIAGNVTKRAKGSGRPRLVPYCPEENRLISSTEERDDQRYGGRGWMVGWLILGVFALLVLAALICLIIFLWNDE
jgi:hypothetical protein